jgi:hypothetical protein
VSAYATRTPLRDTGHDTAGTAQKEQTEQTEQTEDRKHGGDTEQTEQTPTLTEQPTSQPPDNSIASSQSPALRTLTSNLKKHSPYSAYSPATAPRHSPICPHATPTLTLTPTPNRPCARSVRQNESKRVTLKCGAATAMHTWPFSELGPT